MHQPNEPRNLKIYHEEGGRWLINVLSDTMETTKDGSPWRSVRFRFLYVLHAPMRKLPAVPFGEIVTVGGQPNSGYVPWHIREIAAQDIPDLNAPS